jgi:hypothetical protein
MKLLSVLTISGSVSFLLYPTLFSFFSSLDLSFYDLLTILSFCFPILRDGFPVPLKKNVQTLAEEVMEKVAHASRDKNVTFFTAYGFEPCTIGTTKLNFGAWVGLPQSFNYQMPGDVKTDDLMVGQTGRRDWRRCSL